MSTKRLKERRLSINVSLTFNELEEMDALAERFKRASTGQYISEVLSEHVAKHRPTAKAE